MASVLNRTLLPLAWAAACATRAVLASPAGPGHDVRPVKVLILLPENKPPPELNLPPEQQIADMLRVQLMSEDVELVIESQAMPADGGYVEQYAYQRADQVGADAVLWLAIVPPKRGCAAPRMLVLGMARGEESPVSRKEICPPAGERSVLLRVVGLAVETMFKGAVAGLLEERRQKAERRAEVVADRAGTESSRCPPCPSKATPSCPEVECPACQCPPCDVQEAVPGRLRLLRIAAGIAFASHPGWSSPALRLRAEIDVAPSDLIELGAVVAVSATRGVEVVNVKGLYQEWLVGLLARAMLGTGNLEGFAELGAHLQLSGLRALLVDFGEARKIERIDPLIRAGAGGRWWISGGIGLQLSASLDAYLRTQRVLYNYLGVPVTVLDMDRFSLNLGLSLVGAFD